MAKRFSQKRNKEAKLSKQKANNNVIDYSTQDFAIS